MRWLGKFTGGLKTWRWMSALVLALTLVGVQAASAASPGSATIIVFAPGAPAGATVSVEWLDRATGVWIPVDGWTGTLNQTTGSGVPFQAFAVLPANYGQEPFRWVIFNQPINMNLSTSSNAATGNMSTASTNMMPVASNIWGTSSLFTLPNTDGVTLEITVLPAEVLKEANAVIGTNATQGTPAANNTLVQSMGATMVSLPCPAGGCNASAITGKFSGVPATSWITVEWLDSNGMWEPVMGWQGQADFIDASGNLVKQFGVYRQNYGQGPFRWAIYNAPTGGSLLAVSPNFNLPTADGQNEILNLAG